MFDFILLTLAGSVTIASILSPLTPGPYRRPGTGPSVAVRAFWAFGGGFIGGLVWLYLLASYGAL